MDKTVYITGVAGFIGRYVAQHFSSEGWSVIGIDHASPENAPLSSLSSYYDLHLPNTAFGDLLQKHSPDVCIHCAGRSSVGFSITEPSSDFYARKLAYGNWEKKPMRLYLAWNPAM